MKAFLEALDAERIAAWEAMLRSVSDRKGKDRAYEFLASLTRDVENQVVTFILTEMRNIVYSCYSWPPKTDHLLADYKFPTPRIQERVKERIALAKWMLGYDPNNTDWNPTRAETDIMHTVSILTNAMEMTSDQEDETWADVVAKGKGLAV